MRNLWQLLINGFLIIAVGIIALALIVNAINALNTLPPDQMIVTILVVATAIAFIAIIITIPAYFFIPRITSARETSDKMTKQQESNAANSDAAIALARRITLFTLVGITLLAIVIIAAAKDSSDAANNVLTAVLPLFGSWIGTILAYFYGRENFRAGAEASRPQGVDELLRSTPVREKMIEFEEIEKRKVPSHNTEKLNKILDDIKAEAVKAGAENWYRIPIMNDDDTPYCIIHRSTLDQYRVKYAMNNPAPSGTTTSTGAKSVSDLTLEDFLSDPSGQSLRFTSFVVVPKNATLKDAKEAMEQISNCQDVIVTATGKRSEKVIGWITNSIIEKAGRV